MDYGDVGAGRARDILATINDVNPYLSRAWPAPTDVKQIEVKK